MMRRRVVLGVTAVASMVLFGGCGAVLGAITPEKPAAQPVARLVDAPTATVTATAAAPSPVQVTLPAETHTAPAPPPVTIPAATVTVEAPSPAGSRASAPRSNQSSESLVDRGSGGSGGAHYSSCKEARAAGAAPLHRGDPGYSSDLDRDGDGVACE